MRLIGHRGARGEAPENTLSGFRYLRRLGVHAVELDILVSADGELVVIHDGFLDRTTTSHGRVGISSNSRVPLSSAKPPFSYVETSRTSTSACAVAITSLVEDQIL